MVQGQKVSGQGQRVSGQIQKVSAGCRYRRPGQLLRPSGNLRW